MGKKPSLILPVENQVRELDGKLLLACVAAQKGYQSYMGWKGLIDERIAKFPCSVYFAKSITNQNLKMLKINKLLGHKVIAWDEEAVVHYPADIYYKRRVGANALNYIDHLIAWGEDNNELIANFPEGVKSPIHVLGNPRADLLRSEFRDYFASAVTGIKNKYKDFILINTNFGSINGYVKELNVCIEDKAAPGGLRLGRGSLGMPEDYAYGLYRHRYQLFTKMQDMVSHIAKEFPDRIIVLRPHPAEDRRFWQELLSKYNNVKIIAEGNVLLWLLASSVLIHNGCTTAVEAYGLDVPAISYEPISNPRFDNHLPNELSIRCKNIDDIVSKIRLIATNKLINSKTTEKEELFSRFIYQEDDCLATGRIIDFVEKEYKSVSRKFNLEYFKGIMKANKRAFKKRKNKHSGSIRYSDEFMRQRFPLLSVAEVQNRADKFISVIGSGDKVRVSKIREDLFLVKAA